MFYGNPAVVTPQANSSGVWVSNYVGVYHLNDNPSVAGSQIRDSSSRGNHLATVASMSGAQSAGQVGGSIDFGTGQYASSSGNVNLSGTAVTLSAWINLAATSGIHGIAGTESSGSPYNTNMFAVENGKVVYHINQVGGAHYDLQGFTT